MDKFNKVYNTIVTEETETGNRFAVDICFRRKSNDAENKQEKHILMENVVDDFQSNPYFEGHDIDVMPHGNTLDNGSSMLELTLTTTGKLSPVQIERMVKQGGVLNSLEYQVSVYPI